MKHDSMTETSDPAAARAGNRCDWVRVEVLTSIAAGVTAADDADRSTLARKSRSLSVSIRFLSAVLLSVHPRTRATGGWKAEDSLRSFICTS